jgi:hypothetical protein
MFGDLSRRAYNKTVSEEGLVIPAIPNLDHWFRRYVIVDLARIDREIRSMRAPKEVKDFFLIIFASILRNASNADPVPVSGLEVTSHMRKRDEEGRLVNPFSLYRSSLRRGLVSIEDWVERLGTSPTPNVVLGNAMALPSTLSRKASIVLSSPPYQNAVDYYRRHQLEMYWLRATSSHAERLLLLPSYIGRPRIPRSHPLLAEEWPSTGAAGDWERAIRETDEQRAADFRHYVQAMRRVFVELGRVTKTRGRLILVVGQNGWNGDRIPTADLFADLASELFSLDDTLRYRVRNRYLSYARRNGANIDREYVLVFSRRARRH